MLRCSRFIYNLVVDSVHRTLFVNPIDTCVRVSVAMLCAIQYRCFSSFEWNWHNTTDEQSPFHSIAFKCWVARTNVGSHSKNVKSYFTYTETVRHTHQHPAHTCHITDNLNCAESSEVHSSVFPWCRTNDSDDDIRWGYRTVATNTEHIRV